MRKRIGFCVAVLLSLAPAAARAESVITVEPIVQTQARRSPDFSVEGTFWRTFDGSAFGISRFWWVTKDWAEVHAGPTWSPVKPLTIGADIGIEQDGKGGVRPRYAANAWFNHDMYAVSGCLEFANDTFRGDATTIWYDLLATAHRSAASSRSARAGAGR